MEAIDIFYSSVTDCRWFLGNPNLNETRGFTWSINSSLHCAEAADWQISFSESAADYSNAHEALQRLSTMDDSRQPTVSTRSAGYTL